MPRPILAFLALLILLAVPAGAETVARRQMVAASHPLAAEAGLAMLRRGGSAVDAAIAVQAMLTLVEPQSSGIGGGAFLLHWDAAARRLSALDGRETAPAAATPALLLRNGRPLPFFEAATGGRAVGVPGVMHMLALAHAEHGALHWAELFAPAIEAAEQGFEVSPRLAAAIAAQAQRLRADRGGAGALFFLPDGSPVPAGHRLRNPALAATLSDIAVAGPKALHAGPIAEAIVGAVRGHANPGAMTLGDLAGYASVRRDPLCAPHRAVLVCGFPPPSSGGVAVLQILGLLQHQDLAALDPRGLDHAHLLAEAGRLAFADRNRYLADPGFVRVPAAGLLDPVYLSIRAQLIDRERALTAPLRPGNPRWAGAAPLPRGPEAWASEAPQPEDGTAHLSIADARGNVLAMTTTIETGFGAALLVGGFLLNNQLTDFSFLPERDGRPVANRVEPGKRPRSSMAPTIVFDRAGEPVLALGSAGGERIIGHVAQTLLAIIDHGLGPAEALGLPRVAGVHETAELEAGTAAATVLAVPLEARGFPVAVRPNASGLQAIVIQRPAAGERLLRGAADPRREGTVLGD